MLLYFCWKLHGFQGHLGAAHGTHKLVVWACREWKRWPGNFPECTLQWAVGNSRASNRTSLLRLDSWRQLTYYISTYVRAYRRCQLIQLNNQWKVALKFMWTGCWAQVVSATGLDTQEILPWVPVFDASVVLGRVWRTVCNTLWEIDVCSGACS